jgi:NAD-dependent DNA ligase
MGKHLAGYHIAITGTLSKVRADIIRDIEKAGGTFSKTVNGSTTHLVAANPYMSTTKVPARVSFFRRELSRKTV